MINFLRAWKFETGFLLIIGAALAVWATTVYFSPGAQQQRDAEEYLERLQADYANDTYGGATPEETLALFIAALEKGDIELASMYFLPEDREKMVKRFEEEFLIDKNFDHIVQGLASLKKTEGGNSKTVFFVGTDSGSVVTSQVVLDKNPNGVWKISDI